MKEELFPTPTDMEPEDTDYMAGFLSAGDADDDFDLASLRALLDDRPVETERPKKAEPKPDSKKKEKKVPRPKPFQTKANGSKKAILLSCGAIGAVLICVLLVVLIGGVMDPYGNRILPNTTIGGVPVGGMTRLEAYSALKDATASTFSETPMEVSLPGGTISLSPKDTKVKFKAWSAVSAAFRLGRKGGDEEIQAAVAASELDGNNVAMLSYLKINQDFIRTQLEAYAAEHNVAHTELSYRLTGEQPVLEEEKYTETTPTQTLELTLGTPLEEMDVDAVLSEILNAYSCNTMEVTIDSIAYQTTPKAPDLEALYKEFYIAPENTTLDMTTYQQIPGSYGYALDMEQAEKLVAEAQYGETIQIPMAYVKPEILGDEVYFREELGYCETKHTTNEDRNTNLRLACAALDGLILQPGEEFSYNGTLGERTAEKGYKPAAAYSGLNTVNSIGGGVCQVSSTLYNAVLLADMEIVFRINHGFRSSYIGVGLDATVNWGGPDFQFRNNSHFPVMIKAEVSDGFVKVWLYGTDEKDYYIKMTSGYDEDDNYVYSWSYKNKYDKETDELISKEKEAYSCYMK